MIEISNESLAKVLNLWTGTGKWGVDSGTLECDGWVQRASDGEVYSPEYSPIDQEAHALVTFMLKERKYPKGGEIYYQETPEQYLCCVRHWECKFGDKPQDDQPKPIDYSIPVRYDHLISTEELVKRAQERWPDDGWSSSLEGTRIDSDKWDRQFAHPVHGVGVLFDSKGVDKLEQWCALRIKLLTLIDEVESKAIPIEIPEHLIVKDTRTKAERFYAFLATPQPDISPGLWGIVRETEPITVYSEEVCHQCLGMGKFDGVLCVKDGCKARL